MQQLQSDSAHIVQRALDTVNKDLLLNLPTPFPWELNLSKLPFELEPVVIIILSSFKLKELGFLEEGIDLLVGDYAVLDRLVY